MVETITPEEFALQRTANQIASQFTNNLPQEQIRVVYVPINQNSDKMLLYLILGLVTLTIIGGAIIIALNKR